MSIFPIRDDFRAVHITPPGSPASVLFGTGVSVAAPGTARNLLAVTDIEAAHADLVARGIQVSDVFHGGPGFDLAAQGRVAGVDPDHKSYGSWAQFQRPGRQHLAAAGAHDPAPGALAMDDRDPRRPAPRDGRAPRPVREELPAAQLVGLVRRLHGRPPGGQHPGRSVHQRRALHGNPLAAAPRPRAHRAGSRRALRRSPPAAASAGAAADTSCGRPAASSSPGAARRG